MTFLLQMMAVNQNQKLKRTIENEVISHLETLKESNSFMKHVKTETSTVLLKKWYKRL